MPMSDSRISSGRCTMVAPQARAMRLLSVFRSRRMALMPAFVRKCVAKSLRPFSVMTTSGLNLATLAHTPSIQSSSSFRSNALRTQTSHDSPACARLGSTRHGRYVTVQSRLLWWWQRWAVQVVRPRTSHLPW